ncbi:hypothetical protein MTR67_039938 [Solanum verrucosum]|uniref:Uncharacterized protein n=1 Tax=Solanum verrucosum TaxID=315347 RepID=A0AAF0UHR1_SOLVR|nr:hypothetical protein MTR67_039938 [Solanum verrucosum]
MSGRKKMRSCLGGGKDRTNFYSERRRVAEQESMSETVQQIKEQVMNFARRPTTSTPDDTDDESDDDDYVEPTP